MGRSKKQLGLIILGIVIISLVSVGAWHLGNQSGHEEGYTLGLNKGYEDGYTSGYEVGFAERPLIGAGYEVMELSIVEQGPVNDYPIWLNPVLIGDEEHPAILWIHLKWGPRPDLEFHFVAWDVELETEVIPHFNTTEGFINILIETPRVAYLDIRFGWIDPTTEYSYMIPCIYHWLYAEWRDVQEFVELPETPGDVVTGIVEIEEVDFQ